MAGETDEVRCEVTVTASADRAFEVFTEGLSTWWPSAYTWSQEGLERIAIEPFAGGACLERGPYGFRCDWGRVLAWEPPDRVVFTWQIGPTRVPEPAPDRASEVEVRFHASGGSTRVELVHRGFARHGEGAESYRTAMGSEKGWPFLLEQFAAAAEQAAGAA